MSKFEETMSLFQNVSKYCLVSNCSNDDGESSYSALGRVPWTTVFDFDVKSISEGLFGACTASDLTRFRLTTWCDKPRKDESEWFFPRGYFERPETLCCDDNDVDRWKTKTNNDIKRRCEMLAEHCLGSFRTVVVVLWYNAQLNINFLKILAFHFLYLLPKVKIILCYDGLSEEEKQIVRSLTILFPKRFEVYDDVTLKSICNFFNHKFKPKCLA